MEQKTALLVMDMQEGILHNLPTASAFIPVVARAISHAREKGIPVWYVTLTFRDGMPEINPQNKMLAAFKQQIAHVKMEDFAKIHDALAPQANDILITKRRVSAFTGSDLEVLLRAHDINHLVLTGIATGGVVLSTLREAADKDLVITVLSDCCADRDEEVHRVLTTRVFPRQATVLTLEEWMQ